MMADRRVRRTRAALQNALMQMITEQPFDDITVQAIAERADVARATFYLHYADKHDLLWRSMEATFDVLGERLGSIDPDTLMIQGKPLSYAIFAHVEAYRAQYQVILGEQGVMPFLLRMHAYIAQASERHHAPLRRAAPQPPTLSPAFTANFLAGAVVGLLLWSLQEEPDHTPEDMARMFTELAAPGVLKSLGL